MKIFLQDRLLLIMASLAVSVGLFSGLLVMDHHYHASKDWRMFILIAIEYVVMVANGRLSTIKNQKNLVLAIGFLKMALLLIVMTSGALFDFNVIPFPKRSIWLWGIGMTLLAIITIFGHAELVRMLVTKRNISNMKAPSSLSREAI